MSEPEFGLARLLDPVGEEAFFRDHWEAQPLLINRGSPAHYAGLLSAADVDRVVAFTKPKFVDTRGFSREPPRAATFVQGWPADRQFPDDASFPGVSELRRVFAEGKTVILMGMQHRWAPVARLCRGLEAVFHCPVHANMYLTPQGAQGFDAHFDTHEVFVLQLEGAKTWRLYGAARALPLVDERFDLPKDQLGAPREVHLGPGDLLYLPRGFVHEAFTAECFSLHLTVGVNVYRWADLLHEALTELTRRDERFRASVPPGVLNGEPWPADLAGRARGLLDALARGADVDTAARRLGDQFFAHMAPLPGGAFAPAADPADAVDLDTPLERVPGSVSRVVTEGGWVTIEFPGGHVGGPLKIAPALRFVASAPGRFAPRDLPDDLGGEGKLVLTRRLLRERLLRVAAGSGPGTG